MIFVGNSVLGIYFLTGQSMDLEMVTNIYQSTHSVERKGHQRCHKLKQDAHKST